MVGVVAGDKIILADRSFDQLRFSIRLFPAVKADPGVFDSAFLHFLKQSNRLGIHPLSGIGKYFR